MDSVSERLTFSVVVPSYGRPEDLLRCLGGLQKGARLPDEVVVALRDDDVDGQELVRSWCAANELGARVQTALASRPGQIEAMNCGLGAATGDIVCFTDDDCVPQPRWLEYLARHYADSSVGGVGGRDVIHHGGDELSDESRVVGRITWWGRIVGNHHCAGITQPIDVAHLKGANMSFRRALLPGFDENLAGGSACLNDTEASLHVAQQGFRLVYDPAAAVDHYPARRFGQSTRDLDSPELVYSDSHNWVYCMLKYFSPLRRIAFLGYALLVGMGNRYGLAKCVIRLPCGPARAMRLLAAATAGKFAGIGTYRKMKGKTNGRGVVNIARRRPDAAT